MTDIKVSVIIPFYNNLVWLYQAVDSVLEQTYKNLEIIVINDGSREDVTLFTEKYMDKIKYLYQDNKGAAHARNVGIDICEGEYIAFLDSDDIWEPQKIEKQLYYMKINNIIWSHTNYSKFGTRLQTKVVNVSKYSGNIFPICLISCPIATPSVMIQSSVLKKNLDIRFGTGMISGEDTIMWIKLAMKYELGVIDEVLTNVRIRGSNSALLAYSQMRAKSDILNHIKKKNLFNISKNLNMLTKYAFYYCDIFYKILSGLNYNKPRRRRMIELLSRFVYLFPWIIFKYEKIKYLRRDN